MSRFRYSAILITLLASIFLATPVYSDMPDPDSVSITSIDINRYLIESGDVLIVFTPDVAYGTTPDYPIDEAFDFRLIDTDNTTLLGAREAYDFVDDGYGPTVLSFYLSAADNLTWGEEYIIRVTGKPSVFADPPIYDFSIAASDYTSSTSQSDNQEELKQNVLSIASSLETSMAVDLLDETDVGTVLSSYGEELFRNTIPGLQAMAPEIFQVIIYQPNYDPRGWTKEQSDNYSSIYVGTTEGDAMGDFWSSMLGLDFSFATALPIILLCVGMLFISAKMSNQIFHGALNSAILLIIATPAGWVPMAITAIGGFIMSLYASIRLFLKS